MIGSKAREVGRPFPIELLSFLWKANMLRSIAIIGLAISGAVHLFIAPAQGSHAAAHGIFFSALGAAQLTWAIAFWRAPSVGRPLLAWIGIALSAGMISLWMLTQLASPFELEPHAIDQTLLTAKGFETIAFIGLTAYLGHLLEFGGVKTFVSRILVTSLAFGVLVGFSAWGVANIAEAMFPELGHVEKHQTDHVE